MFVLVAEGISHFMYFVYRSRQLSLSDAINQSVLTLGGASSQPVHTLGAASSQPVPTKSVRRQTIARGSKESIKTNGVEITVRLGDIAKEKVHLFIY